MHTAHSNLLCKADGPDARAHAFRVEGFRFRVQGIAFSSSLL